MQYEDYQHQKVHFIGSVAFYYKEVLAEAAKEMGIQLGAIIKTPHGRTHQISQLKVTNRK